ncbi:MAG: family 20 glycosylhydrolase [Phycisphaerae bacterium]
MRSRTRLSPFAIRGLMLDVSRQIERHEFYFSLLDHLARWGFNTLWWHFADDQGFHLKLDSHPEIASPFAFTKEEMRRLVRKAEHLGLDVVPEVESLGHGRFITRLPQYAHLADGDTTHFNAVCPSRPETAKLLGEIIEEVASIFPSPYFHAGLDEVNFGGCPRCRRRGRGRPEWWIYAQHTLAIHDIVTRNCGKRMIIWADHIERQPAMLKVLPKDIIMTQWQYDELRLDAFARSTRAGFQSIAAPALCHHSDLVHPNAQNFRNMDDMVTAVAKMGRRKVLGIVNTWWTSWRGLRDAYLPAVAYTGRMLTAGRPLDKVKTMAWFAEDFFGLPEGEAGQRRGRRVGRDDERESLKLSASSASSALSATSVGRAIWRLHEQVLQGEREMSLTWASPLAMHVAAQVAEEPGFAARKNIVDDCLAVLKAAAGNVRRNRPAFNALVLAARIDAFGLQGAADAKELYRLLANAEGRWCRGADLRPNRDYIARFLARRLRVAQRLCRQADREWDRTRFADDPNKFGDDGRGSLDRPCYWDAMLGKLHRHRAYLARLIDDMGLLSPCFAAK